MPMPLLLDRQGHNLRPSYTFKLPYSQLGQVSACWRCGCSLAECPTITFTGEMAHHILARDPPDSSFRDADARNSFATRAEQEPTPAHAPGAHNAQGSKTRMPPRATSSSENTASRASRSRLEFHKTAHSFPDYGYGDRLFFFFFFLPFFSIFGRPAKRKLTI